MLIPALLATVLGADAGPDAEAQRQPEAAAAPPTVAPPAAADEATGDPAAAPLVLSARPGAVHLPKDRRDGAQTLEVLLIVTAPPGRRVVDWEGARLTEARSDRHAALTGDRPSMHADLVDSDQGFSAWFYFHDLAEPGSRLTLAASATLLTAAPSTTQVGLGPLRTLQRGAHVVAGLPRPLTLVRCEPGAGEGAIVFLMPLAQAPLIAEVAVVGADGADIPRSSGQTWIVDAETSSIQTWDGNYEHPDLRMRYQLDGSFPGDAFLVLTLFEDLRRQPIAIGPVEMPLDGKPGG